MSVFLFQFEGIYSNYNIYCAVHKFLSRNIRSNPNGNDKICSIPHYSAGINPFGTTIIISFDDILQEKIKKKRNSDI